MTTGTLAARSVTPAAATMGPSVLLVFPRFYDSSFWNFKEAAQIKGARSVAPPLGLITVAAMLPPTWRVRLIDRNSRDMTDADFLSCDLVMTGGMLPQEADTLEVIAICQRLGVPVAVGGPAPTSTPHIYAHSDFLVVGEAEGIIGDFIAAWQRGDRRGRFDAEKFKADVTSSPTPRFDLVDFDDYMWVNVQFSRGCPFTCEFCDIIELYGRAPRTKTAPQVLAELDRLLALGHRGHVDFVDDNLIGNKKAIKLFLPHLIAWQKAHDYPFKFSTEASLNLSDDPDLLAMMRDANFFAVFIGIETPDEATLIHTSKKQNTRRSIADSVHRVYDAGMFVTAGFIVGFDTEKGGVAQGVMDCIRETSIPTAMVGLLFALPNTQLSRRLEREGRLFEDYSQTKENSGGDQCTDGINFRPLRPRKDVLTDYRNVLQEVYSPATYFERVRVMGRMIKRPDFKRKSRPSWTRVATDLRTLARVSWRMTLQRPELARHYWRALIDCIRNNPKALTHVVSNMLLYLHLYPFSRHVISAIDQRIVDIETGAWQEPRTLPASADAACSRPPLAVAS